VVPAYDMSVLYALNNSSNTITPIDPKTGKKMADIKVVDPYNLYFMPDGSEAIVVEEANQTLTFTDPKTFAKHSSLTAKCDGINHMDFSIDGKYAIVTCEFDGTLIKVDLQNKKVVGSLKIDISTSGKTNPIKPISQPQDVRVSPDGKVFYIADLITDGVYTIDGDSFTQTGFIPTGIGTHGLYPSRDGKKLYVINRGTETIPAVGSFKGKGKGSVAVLDFASQKVETSWPVDGGSPDMGQLTEDGTQLWLGGRYDNEVYVFDTVKGTLLARIPAGQNPHGLTVWPQPGRYSLGHTGNMR
jgi:DNA-binding beta-propeller fold protein YncE